MLKVDQGALQASVAALEVAHREMAEVLAELETQAQAVLAQWSGEAQQAYAQSQATWSSGMQRLASLLAQARQALDASAQQYDDAERTIQRSWSI